METVDKLFKEKDYLPKTDLLTEVPNRMSFNEELSRELKRKARHPGNLSIIMFDIDHFKAVNDTFGHSRGDQVLKEISRIVSENIRETDFFARWGGEEFIILLPESSLEEAVNLAEKLLGKLEQNKFPVVGKITASFGVAQMCKGDIGETLTQRVDKALYKAKYKGRNRVEASWNNCNTV